MKKLDRRKFFAKLSIGFIGISIINFFGFKVFSKTRIVQKINITVHEEAIKRIK